ncbi:MAG: hypothetical protein ONB05_03535 [candidate division KSB1 bacterium]|nr:hypothetical protein [candidate division KSB1 bacterium]
MNGKQSVEVLEYEATVLADGHLSLPLKIREKLGLQRNEKVRIKLYKKPIQTTPGQFSWFEKLKRQILKDNPDLVHQTKAEMQKEFDGLSQKIMTGFNFQSWEEMQQFMRREEYAPFIRC